MDNWPETLCSQREKSNAVNRFLMSVSLIDGSRGGRETSERGGLLTKLLRFRRQKTDHGVGGSPFSGNAFLCWAGMLSPAESGVLQRQKRLRRNAFLNAQSSLADGDPTDAFNLQ